MPRASTTLSRNKFAKRHYEPIALAMQDARFHLRNTALDQWLCVVNCLVDLFAGDNGQFKRDRFRRACEPGANVRARSRISEARMNSGLLLNQTHKRKSEQMTTIGYARVSTDGQSLQSQTEAVHLAGCGRVYSEKQSGAYTDRPQREGPGRKLLAFGSVGSPRYRPSNVQRHYVAAQLVRRWSRSPSYSASAT